MSFIYSRVGSNSLARAAVLAVFAGSFGCGVIQVNGRPIGSGGLFGQGSAKAKKVAEAYQAFDYKTCTSTASCGREFRERAGGVEETRGDFVSEWNPRAGMENPDPTWIPGWNSLPTDDGPREAMAAYRALAEAAINRTWVPTCHAAYEKYAKDLDAKMADAKRAIDEANGIKGSYSRLKKFIEVSGHGAKRSSESKTEADPAQYEREVATLKAFEQEELMVLYKTLNLAPKEEYRQPLHARFPRDVERDIFCRGAADGHIAGVDPLPELGAYGPADGIVKPVFSAARLAELDKLEKAAATEKAKLFSRPYEEAKKVDADTHEIHSFKSIRKEGNRFVLEFGARANDTMPTNCVDTNKITGISRIDGKFIYETVCHGEQKVITDYVTYVTLNRLPEGLTLRDGDSVNLIGSKSTRTEKEITATPTLHHTRIEDRFDAFFVQRVTRGKTTVFEF